MSTVVILTPLLSGYSVDIRLYNPTSHVCICVHSCDSDVRAGDRVDQGSAATERSALPQQGGGGVEQPRAPRH